MDERGIFYRITDMRNQTHEQSSEITWQCGVLKDDSYESMSPGIHEKGYKAVGIKNMKYAQYNRTFAELASTVTMFRDPDQHFRGISVGAPFKGINGIMQRDDQDNLMFLDAIDEAGNAVGAVNTISIENRDGKPFLTGTNTDWIGYVDALKELGGTFEGKRVAILGAGGAARASIYGSHREGASSLDVYNKTTDSEKIQKLRDQFGVEVFDLRTLTPEILQSYDVIVNSTKVGMHGEEPVIPLEGIRPGQAVIEWVYSKDLPATQLELGAQARGALVVPGRSILIHQAKGQFNLFTGKEAPVDVMRAEVLRATTA